MVLADLRSNTVLFDRIFEPRSYIPSTLILVLWTSRGHCVIFHLKITPEKIAITAPRERTK